MANVLIVLEQFKGHLKKASLGAVTAGKQAAADMGGQAIGIVIGKDVGAAADAASQTGIKVLKAQGAAVENYLSEAYAAVVVDAAKANDVKLVLASATTFGKDLLPRVAALLDAGMASDATSLKVEGGKFVFIRPMWAGNLTGDVVIELLGLALNVTGVPSST